MKNSSNELSAVGPLCEEIAIDASRLPVREAAVVERLLRNLLMQHPDIEGFLLTGSYWNRQTQLPNCDVDINWLGSKNADADFVSNQFVFDGVKFDFYHYFWGNLQSPSKLSLTSAVSLYRAHILWERDDALSLPRQQVIALLGDAEWVQQGLTSLLSDAIGAVERFRMAGHCVLPHGDSWTNPNVWDFFDSCMVAHYPLSVACIRAPSCARKALMETTTCAQRVGLPEIGEKTLETMGAHNLTLREVENWIERAEHGYDLVAVLEPTKHMIHRRYYLDGARAMIKAGFYRECAWPLWRSIREVYSALYRHPASHAQVAIETALDFSERLGQATDKHIAAKVEMVIELAKELEQQKDLLLQHYNTTWHSENRG